MNHLLADDSSEISRLIISQTYKQRIIFIRGSLTDCLPTETYFKIERQTTHSRRHLVTIRSRRVIVRMLSGTCRVFDLRSRDRDSNLTGSTALCLIVCEQDVHPLHSTGSTQEDPRGGGGGYSHFFDKRRLGPSIYHTPPKKNQEFQAPQKNT